MNLLYHFNKIPQFLFFILPLTGLAEEYEPNNILEDAKPIFVNDSPQTHKFDYANDEDWLVFYAQKGIPYDIQINSGSVGQKINPAIELYNADKKIEVELFDFNYDFGGKGEGELLSWQAPADGFYFIRVINIKTEFSIDADYQIKVFLPLLLQYGVIRGKVIDRCTQSGLKAEIITHVQLVSSYKTGLYSMALHPGNYKLTARLNGYKEQSKSVEVIDDKLFELQFELDPEMGCSEIPDSDKQPVPPKEQLKQKAVGVYNHSTGELAVKDVRVGDTVFAVSLQAQEDFSFILTKINSLDMGLLSKPAFYDFDTLLADLPMVFAFDRLYKVQLKRLSAEGAFVIKKADPL